MKSLQILSITLLLFCFGCNKNNDDDDNQSQQQTNQQLLVSGKWYFQSKTPGSYTECEKKGYIQFMNNGTFNIDVFDDSSGSCESLGAVTANYILSNGVNLTLMLGDESQSAVIDSISESQLTITNSTEGEVILFDKTEG
ncbi:MAG: lipocalin family protein [Flavobacteriaceae bacterium]